jgi:hypothetical protein
VVYFPPCTLPDRWRVRTQQNIWISLYEKVSCISRAGWYSGKFNAVKLCQSSSISGPSDTEPILEKISIIWFYQWNRVTGSDDYRFRRTRQITVKPLLSSLFSKVSWMLLTFSSAEEQINYLSKFFFWSLGTFLNSAKDLLTY